MSEDGSDGRRPWDRQDGEPAKWYARFLLYLELGPGRALAEVYTDVQEKAGKRGSGSGPRGRLRPNGSWKKIARQYRWCERAMAWDIEQRDLLALSDRNRRLAQREHRIAITEENLELAGIVLHNMRLPEANAHEARKWLPEIRGLLRDMLTAQRLEYEKPGYEKDAKEERVELQITADDLRAAQRAFEEGKQGGHAGVGGSTGPVPSERALGYKLLVCIGPDARQQLDLAALRAVRTATGLQFARLIDTTQQKFANSLRRARGLGHPIELLHLALPVGPLRVRFTDGWVDGAWLSERLQGVRVLLLVACECPGGAPLDAGLGEWLGVVPYVVSVSEEIAAEDAAVLTQHFWQGIGAGLEPGTALEEALCFCPPAVGEFVVRYW